MGVSRTAGSSYSIHARKEEIVKEAQRLGAALFGIALFVQAVKYSEIKETDKWQDL